MGSLPFQITRLERSFHFLLPGATHSVRSKSIIKYFNQHNSLELKFHGVFLKTFTLKGITCENALEKSFFFPKLNTKKGTLII